MATAHKSRVLDMTQGDPFRLVLQFSMPLFCSNLLQQLYNLTDTALAGHLLGSAALAEIGATAALYGLEVLVHIGINTVSLNGVGFRTKHKVGDTVHAGELLAEVNLNLLEQNQLPKFTVVLITNMDAVHVIRPNYTAAEAGKTAALTYEK